MTKKEYKVELNLIVKADSESEAMQEIGKAIRTNPSIRSGGIHSIICIFEPVPTKKVPLWILEMDDTSGLPTWSYARDAKGNVLYKEGDSIFNVHS